MAVKQDRIANLIKKNLSEIIQFNLKDPKIGFVTITDVVVTSDLSIAKIYVTFLGKKERNEAGFKVLDKSKGFLRSELSKTLSIRKVPQLIFLYDETMERSNRIEKLLYEVSKENKNTDNE
ncbi:MAG: 30S ribosome-binding factor RbfA [Erysipelotrichaceae bacterium]